MNKFRDKKLREICKSVLSTKGNLSSDTELFTFIKNEQVEDRQRLILLKANTNCILQEKN